MNQPALRVGGIPDGYVSLTLYIPGEPNRPQVYVCNKCGCMIGNTIQHDEFHNEQTPQP